MAQSEPQKVKWSEFFDELKVRFYLVGILSFLTLALFATEISVAVLPVALFIAVALLEFLKTVSLLMLVAAKKLKMAHHFWVDTSLTFLVIFVGWFLLMPATEIFEFWQVLLFQLVGWLLIISAETRIFDVKRTYRSFDITYGAPEWMIKRLKQTDTQN